MKRTKMQYLISIIKYNDNKTSHLHLTVDAK